MEAAIDPTLSAAEERPPLRLREELRLLPGEREEDGAPVWLLHDPLSGRYFRLGEEQVELLHHLEAGEPAAIAGAASASLGRTLGQQAVEDLILFLRTNNLIAADAAQLSWFTRQKGRRPSAVAQLAKGYLFVRIPLVRPDRFLDRTLPLVRWLGASWVLWSLFGIGLLGLFLASQRFDQFLHTFLHFFSIEGVALYAAALFGVKILHELGHAYVAKAYGCRVPMMGVALLVLWPVLYTDTTDAWRLDARRARLHIGVAGMAVELAVAALALTAWSFTPDGALRSMLFVLATTTWVMTLAVNLNPLMRFDGYYLLSDWMRTPNLEPRAFALARWWLRERLFGLGITPPETTHKGLILFAYAVWVYRFLLFLGIALLVYHLFFKVLGVLLFAVEIYYFILGPIGREIMAWYKLREAFRFNKTVLRTVILLGAAGIALMVPWRGAVVAPATLQWPYHTLYAPAAAQVISLAVQRGDRVARGQPLLVLEAPDLNFELRQVELRLEELTHLRAREGFNAELRSRALITRSELETQRQRLETLRRRLAQLRLTASHAGELVDWNPVLKPGAWLPEGEPLAAIRGDGPASVMALVDEVDLLRVTPGTRARFYPEAGGEFPLDLTVTEVEEMGVRRLDTPYAASIHGGDLAVRQSPEGDLIPTGGIYRVRLSLSGDGPAALRVLRGRVVIDGVTESLFSRLMRGAMALLVREATT